MPVEGTQAYYLVPTRGLETGRAVAALSTFPSYTKVSVPMFPGASALLLAPLQARLPVRGGGGGRGALGCILGVFKVFCKAILYSQ